MKLFSIFSFFNFFKFSKSNKICIETQKINNPDIEEVKIIPSSIECEKTCFFDIEKIPELNLNEYINENLDDFIHDMSSFTRKIMDSDYCNFNFNIYITIKSYEIRFNKIYRNLSRKQQNYYIIRYNIITDTFKSYWITNYNKGLVIIDPEIKNNFMSYIS
jgi:hypothetical protein